MPNEHVCSCDRTAGVPEGLLLSPLGSISLRPIGPYLLSIPLYEHILVGTHLLDVSPDDDVAVCQASTSSTISRSLLKLMSIELVMPSNHLILCHPVLLLPSIFPSIRIFSSESVLRIRWPKY